MVIQAWMIKAGAAVAVLVAIFFSGWHVKGRIDKAELIQLRNDYDIALRQNENCYHNMTALEGAIAEQNRALNILAEEIKISLQKQKTMYESALASERKKLDLAQDNYLADKTRLMEIMAKMTSSEACHAAWLEVLNVR